MQKWQVQLTLLGACLCAVLSVVLQGTSRWALLAVCALLALWAMYLLVTKPKSSTEVQKPDTLHQQRISSTVEDSSTKIDFRPHIEVNPQIYATGGNAVAAAGVSDKDQLRETIGRTNISVGHGELGPIVWDHSAGCYRKIETLRPEEARHRIVAELIHFSNPSLPNERIISAGRVKAQIIWTIDGTNYPASPGAWVDCQLNSPEFNVGDTRLLIIALSQQMNESWFTVVNRRASLSEPVATAKAFDLWPQSKGTIEIHLINDNGTLATYTMSWGGIGTAYLS